MLKTAEPARLARRLPDLSAPYKTSSKISHRAWFSPEEYKQLYEATRERAENPRKKTRYAGRYEQLHDYVLFMVNTGLAPGRVAALEFRDVKIVRRRDSGETILEIDVRGKRGVGYLQEHAGRGASVRARRRSGSHESPERPAEPTDLYFRTRIMNCSTPSSTKLELKFDREGQRRTAYSLRHTYICLRLMEGADIYQIAKNCRTSVEMIEKYYASHIKNMVDASAINVREPKTPRSAKPRRRRPKATKNHMNKAQFFALTLSWRIACPLDCWKCGRGGTGRRNGLKPIECSRGKPGMQNCSNSGKPSTGNPEPSPADGKV